jgi:hypothetical protein
MIKRLNALSNWNKYCLEAKYSTYNRVEFDSLVSLNDERCTISVSSVTITNLIRTQDMMIALKSIILLTF